MLPASEGALMAYPGHGLVVTVGQGTLARTAVERYMIATVVFIIQINK